VIPLAPLGIQVVLTNATEVNVLVDAYALMDGITLDVRPVGTDIYVDNF
jgi:hypothetical protein